MEFALLHISYTDYFAHKISPYIFPVYSLLVIEVFVNFTPCVIFLHNIILKVVILAGNSMGKCNALEDQSCR